MYDYAPLAARTQLTHYTIQGTGLFLGLGGSIQTGGPLGALLGYLTVGLIVCAVQFALGEVVALLPVTSSFVRHAEFLTDPALGFAVGYNLVYGNLLSIPTEITAICVLFQYWTDINSALWIMLFIVLTVGEWARSSLCTGYADGCSDWHIVHWNIWRS